MNSDLSSVTDSLRVATVQKNVSNREFYCGSNTGLVSSTLQSADAPPCSRTLSLWFCGVKDAMHLFRSSVLLAS